MSARQNSVRSGERGNAFFIVMVSVVLFAALMFTFTRGARQGGENLSSRQRNIAATELIGIAQQYKRAVSRLQMKGCAESQISFETDTEAFYQTGGALYDYTNASAPTDGSCHLFSSAGASLSPYTVPADYTIDPALPCATCSHAQSLYFTTTGIWDVGQDDRTELMMWMGRVTRELCIDINDRLGIPNPSGEPPVDLWQCNADQPFKGTYESCSDPLGDNAAIKGQEMFCVDYNSNGWTYIFMAVLIPR